MRAPLSWIREFTPLDPAETEEAYRRNRRIEFKLTEG